MDKLPNSTKVQESLSKLVGKATSLFKFSSSNASKAPVLDGEIVYCKNNVCIHSSGSTEPIPGYLSLHCSVPQVFYYICLHKCVIITNAGIIIVTVY